MRRPLEDARILLGVSGGIAAYKAVLLARLLIEAGADVDPVLTRGARRFVGPATFEGITGRAVRDDVWDGIPDETHVASGRAADLAIVYPATAHTLARLAAGLADDLLTTTLLAARCPLVVAPAMHTEMWQHPATRANVDTLARRGAVLLGPADGALMAGDSGPGRLVEPQDARDRLVALWSRHGPGTRSDATAQTGDLAGRCLLVTAAGTREPIDPVRFLGNRASGRMGFALAAVAAERGAEVHLVTGPTHLPTPPGVQRTDVTTALEMRDAVFGALAGIDVVVKAAAVADFRPADTSPSKLKKAAGVPRIELVANPDILAELGAHRGGATHPLLVGFAAETDDIEANARDKLVRKGVDLLVVNDVGGDDAGFAVETNRVVVFDREGARTDIGLESKREVAQRILDLVLARLPAAR